MSGKRTVRRSLADLRAPDQERLDRQRGLSETEIDEQRKSDPDSPPSLDADFWSKAELVLPKRKETISIRLDPEILDYFRSAGDGYQSRINAVLRSYVEAKRRRGEPKGDV